MPGKLRVTFAVKELTDRSVTFLVGRTGGRRNEAYRLWVAVKGLNEGGNVETALYQAVRWEGGSEYPTMGEAGPFTLSTPKWTAYVWRFPNTEDPLVSVSG